MRAAGRSAGHWRPGAQVANDGGAAPGFPQLSQPAGPTICAGSGTVDASASGASIHKLFDRGYVTVTPDYRFRVSPRLEDEYRNGKVYYALEGRDLWLPRSPDDQPKREHLERHNDEVFLAG